MTVYRLFGRLVQRRTPLCVGAALVLRRVSRTLRNAGERGVRLAAQWDEKE